LDFSRQIFAKYSNIKFHKNPSSGSRVVPDGRTDRHDEANSRFSQFFERAYNLGGVVELEDEYLKQSLLTYIRDESERFLSRLTDHPDYRMLLVFFSRCQHAVCPTTGSTPFPWAISPQSANKCFLFQFPASSLFFL